MLGFIWIVKKLVVYTNIFLQAVFQSLNLNVLPCIAIHSLSRQDPIWQVRCLAHWPLLKIPQWWGYRTVAVQERTDLNSAAVKVLCRAQGRAAGWQCQLGAQSSVRPASGGGRTKCANLLYTFTAKTFSLSLTLSFFQLWCMVTQRECECRGRKRERDGMGCCNIRGVHSRSFFKRLQLLSTNFLNSAWGK